MIAAGRHFDFVFLDAAKGQYIVWLPDIKALLRDGGILMADNVLLEGIVAQSRFTLEHRDRSTQTRMRAFLYAVTHDPELSTTVLPVGDGVSLSVYQVNYS